jgi:hypothetical protein
MKTILLGLLVVCGGCISGQATEPQICDSQAVMFPGTANPDIPKAQSLLVQSFILPVGAGSDWISKITLLNGQLTMLDGPSFMFLDELEISIITPDGESLTLFDAQSPNLDTTTIEVKASNTNLAKYIDDKDDITLKLFAVSRNFPSTAWGVETNLCASAILDKTYKL